MKNNRYAFTMIELVFVIVILGILAAVAIPKIAATRTDALVSKTAQNIMTGIGEIATYAASTTTVENNLSSMSNAIANLERAGEADLSTNKKAVISMGSVSDCITIEIISNASDDNLTITEKSAVTDSECLALQNVIDAQKYPMKLRGRNVKY